MPGSGCSASMSTLPTPASPSVQFTPERTPFSDLDYSSADTPSSSISGDLQSTWGGVCALAVVGAAMQCKQQTRSVPPQA
eukprot:1179245-Prorocentrum_minimum.AAC.1